MKFIADFHIHSKFSRATAKDLDLENLHAAAQKKGITVIGTGDFTHPAWFSDIKQKLIPAEEGLFKLKDGLRRRCDRQVSGSCRSTVRFILVTEISNIYKKNGKTRKVHNLIFLPDVESVEKFNKSLEKIGNIQSDGRPILGLDAKNLLEIVLETSPDGYLIPAHIWTPWFSILGSKSGFDALEECFEDLTPHIFAVETGLSSDPAMNWRISGLDGLTLISNSDAHSPAKLGREANLLNTELSYSAIKSALKTGDPDRFLGTFEFYPEEGKYHLDGHRKCNVRLWPQMTIEHGGICPVCAKPLTLGVLYRVEALADRPEGIKPANFHPFYNIIPLAEVLSEVLMVGPGSKKVRGKLTELIEKFGSEFKILHFLEPQQLENSGVPLLAEAIRRMRRGKIELSPGYDGEFGKINIFSPSERESLLGQKSLFSIPAIEKKKLRVPPRSDDPGIAGASQTYSASPNEKIASTPAAYAPRFRDSGDRTKLNHAQRLAVEHPNGTLLIVAGPGTGKTLTLTYRIAFLISQKNVSPRNLLALTFTQHAAREMRQRLRQLLANRQQLPLATTFHAFCFQLLAEQNHENPAGTILDDVEQRYFIKKAIHILEQRGIHTELKPQFVLDRIITAKQRLLGPRDNLEAIASSSEAEAIASVYRIYQKLLFDLNHCDYEDLIYNCVMLLENNEKLSEKYQNRFPYVLVDEYQDLNHGQYRVVRALCPPGKNLFVIGDPDQSIYGFRGSESRYFRQFLKDYPDAEIIRLKQNYRSTQTIIDAASQVISLRKNNVAVESKIYSRIDGFKTLTIIEAVSEKAEAVAIGKYIEKMIGGIGFHSIDFDNIDGGYENTTWGFSDFAILYRTKDQGNIIADVLLKAGIPCQTAGRQEALYKKGLAELISVIKVIEGWGSYPDFENLIRCAVTDIGAKTAAEFTAWGIENGWHLSQALHNAQRFPIRGMKVAVQKKLNALAVTLNEIGGRTDRMQVQEKLSHILQTPLLTLTEQRRQHLKAADKEIVAILSKLSARQSENQTKIELGSDTDFYNPRSEKVTLLTMHAAKGLEFPVVFIAGCEKGFVPFHGLGKTPADIDEERRLFYVAMTRAKERLFLSYANKRVIYGKTVTRKLSSFVKDIKKQLTRREMPVDFNPKAEMPVQMKLFY
jgi:uncharacterized protein (TIGR00375 family)